MAEIREIGGRRYQAVSVTAVSGGDFIKVKDRLVEIVNVEIETYPDSDRPKGWSITGKDGNTYGMFDVGLYLKPLDKIEEN